MDPVDPGQEQEQPSEQTSDLLASSKGRQRKKNSKYLDYYTTVEDEPKKQPRRSSRGGRKTPARGQKPKNATQQNVGGDQEAMDRTAQESDEMASEETPKKTPRARKTPSKKTPARKTHAAIVATAAGGAGDSVQQDNGTPRPKRKYVRKQCVQDLKVVSEPPNVETLGESQNVAASTEETQPEGRSRRGAAKAALKYLHRLAKDMLDHNSEESSSKPGANREVTNSERKTPKRGKVSTGHKRKRLKFDSDGAEDEDFVPDVEEDEEFEDTADEEEGSEEDLDLESDFGEGGRSPAVFHTPRSIVRSKCKASNGLSMNAMNVVWEFAESTKKFREEHYSSWVFPNWIPSTSAWHRVPQSDLDKYLPEELHSTAFKVSREGLRAQDTPPERLNRFGAMPFHPDRWDMLLFAGGPIWAMEWCPTPDGVPATQYVALACHKGMDDQHYVNQTYTGHGLVQLWDVGQLEYDASPKSKPSLAYALAQDKGFIWHLKWCPAGGWELPSRERKAPFLPRLGLLAVATSIGVVTIYSLPHPDALHSNNKLSESENTSQQLPIYKAQGVVTLQLGSFKAPRLEKSGQVLSMDWLPVKPHNIIAIGFYDGTVGLWNLSTHSSLLRIREPNSSLSLLPYRCILAHDHGVRAMTFCPASGHLLVTAGEDRYIKTWDLRRLYDPITVQKRYLTNEICWPLNGPGLMVAQECAYAPKGSQGIHYIDHYLNTSFVMPRTGTVWSISYTDWMNIVVTSDNSGEVVFAVLPQINHTPPYMKRTIERRFPVYFTSVVPYTPEEHQKTERMEGHAVKGPKGGATEGSDAQLDKENENNDDHKEGKEGEQGREKEIPTQTFETYKEAVKKYCLHHTDFNMRSFTGSEKQAVWQRMKNTEMKIKLNLDDLPLAALHKVRFNPNMNSHTWMVSGGQTGLVRLNCLRAMISPQAKKILSKSNSQVRESPGDEEDDQTGTEQL